MSLKLSSKPEIIAFGGSFDPPHQGHLDCVELAKQTFPQAKFLIIPALLAPLTSDEHKNPSASFDDRLQMCHLAFSSCIDPKNILDIEKSMATPNYTIQTLHYLEKLYPKQNLGWLMGFDQLQQFHRWSEPRAILQVTSLVVLPRSKGNFQHQVEDLAEKLKIPIAEASPNQIILTGMKPIFLINHSTAPAASRDLRRCLQESSTNPDFITPAVLKYIRTKKLYGTH